MIGEQTIIFWGIAMFLVGILFGVGTVHKSREVLGIGLIIAIILVVWMLYQFGSLPHGIKLSRGLYNQIGMVTYAR